MYFLHKGEVKNGEKQEAIYGECNLPQKSDHLKV